MEDEEGNEGGGINTEAHGKGREDTALDSESLWKDELSGRTDRGIEGSEEEDNRTAVGSRGCVKTDEIPGRGEDGKDRGAGEQGEEKGEESDGVRGDEWEDATEDTGEEGGVGDTEEEEGSEEKKEADGEDEDELVGMEEEEEEEEWTRGGGKSCCCGSCRMRSAIPGDRPVEDEADVEGKEKKGERDNGVGRRRAGGRGWGKVSDEGKGNVNGGETTGKPNGIGPDGTSARTADAESERAGRKGGNTGARGNGGRAERREFDEEADDDEEKEELG